MGLTLRPNSLDEVLLKLSGKSMILLNGGTDLMVTYRTRSDTLPDFEGELIAIGHLEELQGILISPKSIRIGSGVTLAKILEDPRVPEAIKAPLRQIGSVAIRNMGTLAGNLCHASPAADSLPMLTALDALVECRSLKGSRLVPVSDFILGPGRTDLGPDELVTALEIPNPKSMKADYLKLGGRAANAIAKLSLYTAFKYEEGRLTDIRIAFGALAPKVIRLREAELRLIREGSGAIPDILEIYRQNLDPIDDLRSTREYRLDVAIGLLERSLREELMHAI